MFCTNLVKTSIPSSFVGFFKKPVLLVVLGFQVASWKLQVVSSETLDLEKTRMPWIFKITLLLVALYEFGKNQYS